MQWKLTDVTPKCNSKRTRVVFPCDWFNHIGIHIKMNMNFGIHIKIS